MTNLQCAMYMEGFHFGESLAKYADKVNNVSICVKNPMIPKSKIDDLISFSNWCVLIGSE